MISPKFQCIGPGGPPFRSAPPRTRGQTAQRLRHVLKDGRERERQLALEEGRLLFVLEREKMSFHTCKSDALTASCSGSRWQKRHLKDHSINFAGDATRARAAPGFGSAFATKVTFTRQRDEEQSLDYWWKISLKGRHADIPLTEPCVPAHEWSTKTVIYRSEHGHIAEWTSTIWSLFYKVRVKFAKATVGKNGCDKQAVLYLAHEKCHARL